MTIKLLLIPLLILPTVEDIKTREIRNIHWILIVVSKSLLMIIEKDKEELYSSLFGMGIALLIFIVSYLILKDGIGFGDIKLLSAVAFFLGSKLFLRALLFISVMSILFSSFLLAAKKVTKKTSLPFAPFILAGTVVTMLVEVIR